MTTTVKVINQGSQFVKVELQGRDGGRFTEVDEFTVEPGTYRDIMVHSTQSFQVSELKE